MDTPRMPSCPPFPPPGASTNEFIDLVISFFNQLEQWKRSCPQDPAAVNTSLETLTYAIDIDEDDPLPSNWPVPTCQPGSDWMKSFCSSSSIPKRLSEIEQESLYAYLLKKWHFDGKAFKLREEISSHKKNHTEEHSTTSTKIRPGIHFAKRNVLGTSSSHQSPRLSLPRWARDALKTSHSEQQRDAKCKELETQVLELKQKVQALENERPPQGIVNDHNFQPGRRGSQVVVGANETTERSEIQDLRTKVAELKNIFQEAAMRKSPSETGTKYSQERLGNVKRSYMEGWHNALQHRKKDSRDPDDGEETDPRDHETEEEDEHMQTEKQSHSEFEVDQQETEEDEDPMDGLEMEEDEEVEDPLGLKPPTAAIPPAFGIKWPSKAKDAMTKRMIDQFARLYDQHAESPQWNNYMKVFYADALKCVCPPEKKARQNTSSHILAERVRNSPPHFMWAYFYLIIYQDEFLIGSGRTAAQLLRSTKKLKEIREMYDWEPSLDSPGPRVQILQNDCLQG